jgi:hypothetical protein
MVKLRMEPQDEYMHALESASNFNESMYFNVFDPEEKVGGFLRHGNRANEGYAELTTCVYLPDGRVAFMFKRPEISDNDAFDAGGTKFEVITPFEELRTTYDGKVVMLDEPLQMADPRRAFTNNPYVECHIDLTHRGVSPMYGGEPVNDDGTPLSQDYSGGFARGHYEQHMAVTGTVRIGDEEWAVKGNGLRDHSWGPRFWSAPWYYRWLTANFGDDFGFVVSIVTAQDGKARIGGMVLRDGEYEHSTAPPSTRPGVATTFTTRRSTRPRPLTRARTTSAARCSTSSRCATGARHRRAKTSSRASPKA